MTATNYYKQYVEPEWITNRFSNHHHKHHHMDASQQQQHEQQQNHQHNKDRAQTRITQITNNYGDRFPTSAPKSGPNKSQQTMNNNSYTQGSIPALMQHPGESSNSAYMSDRGGPSMMHQRNAMNPHTNSPYTQSNDQQDSKDVSDIRPAQY